MRALRQRRKPYPARGTPQYKQARDAWPQHIGYRHARRPALELALASVPVNEDGKMDGFSIITVRALELAASPRAERRMPEIPSGPAAPTLSFSWVSHCGAHLGGCGRMPEHERRALVIETWYALMGDQLASQTRK